jgi:molybdate transport system substrate-binding protein
MSRRPAAAVIGTVLAAMMIVLAGCSGAGGDDSGPGSPAVPGGRASSTSIKGAITVLAAASLTEAFDTLGGDFEKIHPQTSVTFSFGSSATLATQVNQGAPADVFASADERTMKIVSDAGNAAGTPAIFATNTLQIAVPAGNPGKITGLKDFSDPDRKTVLCAEQVPCGAAAQQVFDKAGITPRPVSYEQDVKAALQKVEQNEVDAAMVYRTDVRSAGSKVQGVDVPGSDQVINKYPITVLEQSSNTATARAFVEYVRSAAGAAVLRKAGFGSATS